MQVALRYGVLRDPAVSARWFHCTAAAMSTESRVWTAPAVVDWLLHLDSGSYASQLDRRVFDFTRPDQCREIIDAVCVATGLERPRLQRAAEQLPSALFAVDPRLVQSKWALFKALAGAIIVPYE